MPRFEQWSFPASEVKSLTWEGDTLVDWVRGGTVYQLDGAVHPSYVNYAYRFDTAVVSPSGSFAVLYERLGTKGLIVNRARDIVREINRSFYCANAYDYPVTVFPLANGREVIAHCPAEYNQLEIEDVLTGECLTHHPARTPIDMFFSRLATDTSSTYLLSAGWVWHPWDVVALYDIAQVLADPTLLDGYGLAPQTAAEVSTAAFGLDSTLLVGSSDESFTDGAATDDERRADPLGHGPPHALAIYDLRTRAYRSVTHAADHLGSILPVSPRAVVSFSTTRSSSTSRRGTFCTAGSTCARGSNAAVSRGDTIPHHRSPSTVRTTVLRSHQTPTSRSLPLTRPHSCRDARATTPCSATHEREGWLPCRWTRRAVARRVRNP